MELLKIKIMNYYITKYGIIIDEKNVVIPVDDNDVLYKKYVTYLKANGVLLPTDYLTPLDLEIQENENKNTPTKEELIATVNFLDEQLKEVKQQLNELI